MDNENSYSNQKNLLTELNKTDELLAKQDKIIALENELAVYNAIYENIPVSIFAVDTTFRLTYFNTAFSKDVNVLLGHIPKKGDYIIELLGEKGIQDLADAFTESFSLVVNGEQSKKNHCINFGEKLFKKLECTSIFLNGNLSGISGYITDYKSFEQVLNDKNQAQIEQKNSFGEEQLRNSLIELERAHALIKEKEVQLSAIIENTTDIIISLDKDLKIALVNQTYKRKIKSIFGINVGTGLDIFEITQEDDKNYYKKAYARVLGGESFLQEKRHINGETSEEFYNPIRNDDGKIVGLAVFIRDITERKEAEEKLRKNQQLLNLTGDLTKVGGWEFDIEKEEYFLTDQMYLVRDLEIGSDLTMSNTVNFYSKEDAEMLRKKLENLKERGESYDHEIPLTTAKGREIWVRSIGQSENKDGKIIRLYGAIQDITEIKSAERELRQNKELLDLTGETAKVGGWQLEVPDLNQTWTEGTYRIHEIPLGQKIDWLTGLNFYAPEAKYLVEEAIEEAIAHGKNFDIELPFITSLGKKLWVKTIGKVEVKNGITTRIFGALQDISDRKAIEIQIKENTKELIDSHKKMAEYRLMALRSVMNPHFLFNSLNSIQYFIAKNDRQQALVYLSLFSKLIRSILNSSIQNSNTLQDEINILKFYIELESLRFDNKFTTIFEVENGIDLDNIEIPSLILQPYVENAILHGLYNKEGHDGVLKISLKVEQDDLFCIIEDNGVGRAEAKRIKEGNKIYKSVGMLVTEERLKLINQGNNLSVKIIDLYDKSSQPAGTRIEIQILI